MGCFPQSGTVLDKTPIIESSKDTAATDATAAGLVIEL